MLSFLPLLAESAAPDQEGGPRGGFPDLLLDPSGLFRVESD